MYNTSTRWRENIYQNHQTYINIYIDDVLINSKYLYDLKKGGILFDNEFELGATPSQYIELKLKKGIVTNPKKIKLEFGMFYNDYWYTVDEIHNMTVAVLNNTFIKNLMPNFETIPIGEYTVDDYNEEDKNVLLIKASDNMIKFDIDDGYCDLSGLIGDSESPNFGATHLEIAQYICNLKGVELGSTSFLNAEQKEYVYDNEIKAREYISYIAECAGGFAVIGRDGKLYFRTIYQDTMEIPLNKFKTYKEGEEYKISQVVYANGVERFAFGDTTRNTVYLNPNNMFMTEETEVQNIYNAIKDITINSFSGTTFIDPAIDIGDKLIAGDFSILYQGEIKYQKRWITDIQSIISIKAKEETTIRKVSQKTINRRVQSRIDEEAGRIILLTEQQTEDEERMSQIELDVDEITSEVHRDYSTTTEMNTAIGTAKSEAIASANNSTDSKLENYSTTVQMNSAINQKANEITSSVSETYITKADSANNISNAKNEAIASANSNTDTKLQNYSTTLQMNTAITQKANEINSSVSETYITKADSATNISTAKTEAISSANSSTDSKLLNYSTTTEMTSAINQKANEINLSVSQNYSTKTETTDAINDINIGARNLQLGSADWNDTAWLTKTGVTISGDTATVAKGNRPTCNPIEVKPGDILTISVDIKSTVSYSDTAGICLDFLNSNKTRVTNVDWKPLSITTEWQRMSKTFTVPDNNQIKYFAVGLRSSSTQTNSFRHLKVERGNKATDWTPAPEDIDEELGGKLNEEDFTGANIILTINNGTSSATIDADKISLDGKEIDLTAGNITIDSDNFSVDENGNITATSGKIGGFTLGVNSFVANLASEKMEYPYDSNDLTRIRNIMLGNITPTTEDYNKYDLNDDGTIDAIDLLIVSRIINGYYDGRAVFELNTKKSEEAISIKNSSGKRVVNLGVFGSYLQQITADKIYSDSIECDNLMVGNTEILGEQTLYSTSVAINSSSYKTLTGLPDLTEYIGRTVNIYIKYNGDQAKKYSFVAGSSSYFAEYVRDFNGNDMWHTLFKIENTNSTSWKITTANSYVVSSSGIAQINITDSNYMFYIEKITIN